MNDFTLAAIIAAVAAVLFIAAAVRADHDSQYRRLTSVARALVVIVLALALYDVGRIVEGIGNFGQDLQNQFPSEP